MEAEALKEIWSSLRGLENSMTSLKAERVYQQEEIKAMIARMLAEVQNLYVLVRDGSNGKKALIERMLIIERDVLEMRDAFEGTDIDKKVDKAVADAMLRNGAAERIENQKGKWAFYSALIAAAIPGVVALIVMLFK